MKNLRFAVIALATTATLVRAQDDQQQQRPPTEIPDFSNLDEYIYEPKSILSYGFRTVSGAKLKFFGGGRLATSEDPGAATGANLLRTYHDGSVSPDARTAGRVDSSGNPVLDPDSGSQILDPIAPDGRTNTWSYQNASQASQYDGFIAFHNYTADIIDGSTRSKDSNTNFGMELAVSRDMGKLFGGRVSWQLIAGMSINDLSGSTIDKVQARLTALTDIYSLNGQVAPTAPYSAPSSSTETLLDSAGNAILNADGTTQSVTTDTTVLLGNQPAARASTSTVDSASVTTRWKISGAYYTFRAGPTLLVPFGSRFRLTLSAGPALIYAGSNYAVTQVYQPETGAEISDTSSSSTAHLLPGYYADAAVQFDITERTGLYAGAVFQGSGDYTQDVNSTAAHYTTKIDLGRQQGFRSGVTIRF